MVFTRRMVLSILNTTYRTSSNATKISLSEDNNSYVVTTQCLVEATKSMKMSQLENPPSTMAIVMAVVATSICVASAVGNIIVLLAIIKSRRLHTTSNVYICALAVTDLYTALVHPVNYIFKTIRPDINVGLCGILISVTLQGCFTSLMMIEAISVDRFLAIYWPFQYRKYCTKSRAVKGSVGIITFSVVVGAIMFSIFLQRDNYISCWDYNMITPFIAILVTATTCCVALELTVMYGAMFYKSIKHQKRLSIGYFDKSCKDMTILDIKALKTCSVVLGSFMFTWFPPLILLDLAVFTDTLDVKGGLVFCMFLPAVNSALDPLVYAIMRKDIQKGIRRLFRKRRTYDLAQVE